MSKRDDELREKLKALKPHTAEQLPLGDLLSYAEVNSIMELIQSDRTALLDQLVREMPKLYEIKDHKNIGDGTGYYHDIGFNTAIREVTALLNKAKGEL